MPETIRSQLAGKGHTFRIHLEHCPDNTGRLEGTWSSQHVTYDLMFLRVKKVHDPFDKALTLINKTAKQQFKIVDISSNYAAYQTRMKTAAEALQEELLERENT